MYSLESEAAVIGALMWGEGAFEHCARLLPEHFHDPVHQALFVELKRRNDASRPVDAASLRDWWKSDETRTALDGDTPYLADLMRDAPENDSVQAYADQVREYAERRRLVEIGRSLTAQAENTELAPREALEASERDLASLAETGSTGRKVVSACMALETALRDNTQGTPTGHSDLDAKFLGWKPGRLYIGAGRPGMGKSLFGADAGLQMALRGRPAAFVSLEMGAEEVAVRLAAALSGVPYSDIEQKRVTDEQMSRIGRARDQMADLPFTILDMPGASVGAIRNALRRLDRDGRRQGGLGVSIAVIDYLQLVSAPSPSMGLYEATTKNSQALKQMARELQVPVMALAQLNRGVEQRQDKHPVMSDLRDSGAIEQDADVIFGLYREAYYAQQEEPGAEATAEDLDKWQRKKASRALDVDILKQRGGATGRVQLYCNAATGEISNMDRRDAA